MTQRNNILHELRELGSSLAHTVVKNPYDVPAGYFEALPFSLLNRVKAMEASSVSGELTILAPWLGAYPKRVPYTVPAGYFEDLEQRIAAILHASKEHESHADELKDISPLLGSLKKQMPFAVPGGYFESSAGAVKPAKVFSLRRSWLRYAAAAVITGLFIAAGFMLLGGEKTPGAKALAGFTRDVKKMDETQKEKLIDLIDAGLNGKETARVNNDTKSNEVKELLQGVSEEELKDFQEQTEDIQEVLMNEP